MTSKAESDQDEPVEVSCPFPECDWEYTSVTLGTQFDNRLSAEHRAERHYEDEHAGRVRVQVTLETEQPLGSRDPKDIRDRLLEDPHDWFDWGLIAHVRTEVLQEADDHEAAFGGEDDD